jgi:hypothetical protein
MNKEIKAISEKQRSDFESDTLNQELFDELNAIAKRYPSVVLTPNYKPPRLISECIKFPAPRIIISTPSSKDTSVFSLMLEKDRKLTGNIQMEIDPFSLKMKYFEWLYISINGKLQKINSKKPWLVIVDWKGDGDVPSQIEPILTTFATRKEALKRVRTIWSSDLHEYLGKPIAICRAIEGQSYNF